MARLDVEEVPYKDYSNRQLVALPLVALAVAIAVILGAFVFTGAPVSLGLDFTGGTELRFSASDASTGDIETAFEEAGISVASVRSVGSDDSYILTTQETDSEALETVAERVGDRVESIDSRSATFGSDTQQQALFGVLIAFGGMSVLVALIFRALIPSIAVVVSAFSDIVIPVALMNLLGIDLTLGAVAALLMLIGYSVDSDILLNNHILRRHGGFYESAYRAMRTGVSMTVTSIAAMTTMFVASRYLGIPLLPDVALILVFGLIADLMNTYMLNMSLLRWYKFERGSR
ncbi:MAG: protein translocase subunit secF [halophilic archaeon J07HX64]|jgi:protein translocase subunit secF|nr:MAG: protein translocase subunit secF [halophilic archaeon J07HX64]